MIKFYYISFIALFASYATSFLYTNSNLKLVYPKFKVNTKTLFMANDGKDKRRNNENRRPQFPDKRGSDLATTSGNPIRIARISRALRDELSSIICEGDVKANVYPDYDLLKATSVCEVDVSIDLTTAIVYVSVLGNSVEKRQIFVWLCENVGQVRFELAKRLKHMKRIPTIFFKLANNQAAADLVTIIEEIAPKEVFNDEVVDFEELE